MTMVRRALVASVIVAAVIAGVVFYRARERHRGLPPAASPAYEQATRQFYRGLAELQVGLLDAAVQHFGEAATIAKLAKAGGRLGKAPFVLPVKDFYLTNPIARASAVMAECSALASNGFKQAAE